MGVSPDCNHPACAYELGSCCDRREVCEHLNAITLATVAVSVALEQDTHEHLFILLDSRCICCRHEFFLVRLCAFQPHSFLALVLTHWPG
jgi:hypothetical protein